MKFLLLVILTLFSFSTYAFVDMKNANYSHTWTDVLLDGTGYNLQLKRTYNSRSLHNGLFGFGWCSDYESKLKVTPEGNIKIVVCGGGNEVEYVSSGSSSSIKKTIAKIMNNLKATKKYTEQNLKTINNRLLIDVWEREKYAKQFNISRNVKSGIKYLAFGRKKESIILSNNQFKRTLADGSYEKYNINGQLIYMYDRNNNFLKISYKNGFINKVTDNNGRSLSFKVDKKSIKVVSVKGPKGMDLVFKYKSEDLIYAKNAWKNIYTYEYDDLHNLTRVTYPDKTDKKLTYDKNKDWVMSFKDRSNCIEKYTYTSNKSNPLNHYSSTVRKKCGKKITNTSKYEFIHKERPDGSRYLSKTAAVINGQKSETTYHPKYGKALNITRANSVTKFTYYNSGEVKTKTEPFKTSTFFYQNKCQKVSKVVSKFYRFDRKTASRAPKSKKLFKTINTDFSYKAPKCNLYTARNSIGQKIRLKYDKNGRIASIIDQAKKVVHIKYNNKIGKPRLITRPGIGSIRVSYNPGGKIKKVDSKEGPIVASQVAGIFSNLLEVISPATSELDI